MGMVLFVKGPISRWGNTRWPWKMDQGHASTTGHLLRVQPTLTSNTDQSVKGAKQSANVISLDIEPILIIRLILLQGHSFSVPDFEMIFSRKNIHLGVKFDGETEYKVKFRFHPETRKIADLLALLHASFQFCRWSIKNIRKDCQFANLGHIQALNCSCIFLPKMIRRTRKNR